jgi:hypothetical protein
MKGRGIRIAQFRSYFILVVHLEDIGTKKLENFLASCNFSDCQTIES